MKTRMKKKKRRSKMKTPAPPTEATSTIRKWANAKRKKRLRAKKRPPFSANERKKKPQKK